MLVCEHIQQYNYDPKNDILRVKFSNDRGYSYGDDGAVGIEIMRDIETDEITGLLIYDPLRQKIDRQQKLKGMGYFIDLDEILKAFRC